jgi:hypothetical protein
MYMSLLRPLKKDSKKSTGKKQSGNDNFLELINDKTIRIIYVFSEATLHQKLLRGYLFALFFNMLEIFSSKPVKSTGLVT